MSKNVRLSDHDLKAIKDSFIKHFHEEDHLWLFGSRAQLYRKGGDIDLYIETTEPSTDIAFKKRMDFIGDLWDLIGEQKIDIVLNILAKNSKLPIYDIAKETGVKLI